MKGFRVQGLGFRMELRRTEEAVAKVQVLQAEIMR